MTKKPKKPKKVKDAKPKNKQYTVYFTEPFIEALKTHFMARDRKFYGPTIAIRRAVELYYASVTTGPNKPTQNRKDEPEYNSKGKLMKTASTISCRFKITDLDRLHQHFYHRDGKRYSIHLLVKMAAMEYLKTLPNIKDVDWSKRTKTNLEQVAEEAARMLEDTLSSKNTPNNPNNDDDNGGDGGREGDESAM